eukprot:4313611-Amphidinium_carterae.2
MAFGFTLSGGACDSARFASLCWSSTTLLPIRINSVAVQAIAINSVHLSMSLSLFSQGLHAFDRCHCQFALCASMSRHALVCRVQNLATAQGSQQA